MTPTVCTTCYIFPQYRNAGNALAHYDGTGNEILEQTGGLLIQCMYAYVGSCLCVWVFAYVRACIHVCVCVLRGSISKWSGHQPANQKVAGSISPEDTLVLLLFPLARNFTHLASNYPAVE